MPTTPPADPSIPGPHSQNPRALPPRAPSVSAGPLHRAPSVSAGPLLRAPSVSAGPPAPCHQGVAALSHSLVPPPGRPNPTATPRQVPPTPCHRPRLCEVGALGKPKHRHQESPVPPRCGCSEPLLGAPAVTPKSRPSRLRASGHQDRGADLGGLLAPWYCLPTDSSGPATLTTG